MVIDERCDQCWAIVRPTANYSTNGYPSRIATTTRPSGDGVVNMGLDGGYCAKHLELLPYGVGSATDTFSLKVLGWRRTDGTVGTPLWIPEDLCIYAITLGTGAGVAGADLTASSLFATTVTMTGGPTFVTAGASPVTPDWCQISPGSNANAFICVTTFGFPILEVIFTTGGSATSCNSLYCRK